MRDRPAHGRRGRRSHERSARRYGRRGRTGHARPARRPGRTLLTAALLLLVGAGCSPLDDAMVLVFGRSMRDQPSLDPYENPQPPPENSVPFASGNYPSGPDRVNLGRPEGTAEPPPPFEQRDVVANSEVVTGLENPVESTAESLERGEVVYERYCALCHGSEGVGADAPLAPAHGMLPGIDLATGPATGYTDGYLYGIVRVGRGMMPAYGDKVTHYDRWHVVNYVRRLQEQGEGAGEGADGTGAEDGGEAEDGEAAEAGGDAGDTGSADDEADGTSTPDDGTGGGR